MTHRPYCSRCNQSLIDGIAYIHYQQDKETKAYCKSCGFKDVYKKPGYYQGD